MKFKIILLTTILVLAGSGLIIFKNKPSSPQHTLNDTWSIMSQYLSDKAPHVKVLQAFADENIGDATCNAINEGAFDSCNTILSGSTYQHGALKYFNSMLCFLNSAFPSGAENALCHFSRSMGMNPDLSALPASITKTFGALEVNLTVTAPTEDFALSLDYDAKGVVTVDGNQYMIV